MKVKKFTAKTMPEAMQQIRKELGSDAVILQSKEVKKGGVLGLFKNKRIEVVAALDELPVKEKLKEAPLVPKPFPQINNLKKDTSDDAVLQEVKFLKELIQEKAFISNTQLPPLYELTRNYLLKQELDEQLTDRLLKEIENTSEEDAISTKQEMKHVLERKLNDQLKQIPSNGLEKEKQIIQFVGPTGVGKTTTLAKVAAKSILEDKKKVALITMDTYRIAAIDQLTTYARILDVPLEVAYSLEDYTQALRKFKEFDFIFVDTAGRNFRNPQYVKELKETVEIEKMRVETLLILSLTAKAQDISDIYQQFEPIGIEKVIFTKLDETLTYGSIFNICLEEQKQVLYMTNGQNVPDDLVQPTKERMISMLLSRYDHD